MVRQRGRTSSARRTEREIIEGLRPLKGDSTMRLTDCALIDQGLLAVEVMPNVPKLEIAPTPAHEEEAWERHARAPRSAYQQVGSWRESFGDEGSY